ncbi:ABC transporter permease [Trueperella pyogenes]|uniref:ABC transporter permease n=1 Tax=Trueperella pyogenes TaxID=1661 RepID=UPI000F8535B1|nr:ABC transporter permease [Trueperella pyogenes]AZR02882.1 ABC transporter permease [Trueperella pyogenes]UVJ56078.1 ABC transporter permease [Trueperella pyogenes]WHU58816.1 ABC transporter permease [Trueperella pyogenes]
MNLFIQETKKLLHLTRSDPRSLAAGIIAPTVILLIFGLTFGNFGALKLAFVNNDVGEMGNELATSIFSQTSPLSGKPYFKQVDADAVRAANLYEAGEVAGILTIPHDFTAQLDSGPGQINYEFNNSNSDMAKNLRLYLDEGIYDFYHRHLPGMDLRTTTVLAVPTQVDWFSIMAVGIVLLAFLMGSMFNYLYLFNKERLYSTLVQYRLASGPLVATFIARLVVALGAGLLTASFNALLVWLMTGVNIAPHSFELLPIMAVLGIAFVSFAALVSTLVNKFSGAAMLTMISAVVAWFLSGGTTSVKYATGYLLDVALALPSSYGLSQIRAIVFDVDQSVGGLLAINRGWALMCGYVIILVGIAYAVYRRKLSAR